MKAMVLHSTGNIDSRPLKYEDIPIPEISDGEVLIKVHACGVCRSQLHTIEGEWGAPMRLPLVVGHEIAGEVVKTGRRVSNLKIGDRVGLQPTYNTCNSCEYCLTGRENLCDRIERTGGHVDGGYAEYVKGVEQHTYLIPGNLSYQKAAPLFCPGATAYRAVCMAEPAPYKTMAVFGVGGVGHMAVQFARLHGARTVAVDRSKKKLELAERFGAVPVEYGDTKKLARLGIDDSIVFAPSDEVIAMARNATKKGGRIVIGVEGNVVDFDFRKEQRILGCLVGTRNDVNNVLKLASEGRIGAEVAEYRLEEANEVLAKMKKGELVGRAVLVP